MLQTIQLHIATGTDIKVFGHIYVAIPVKCNAASDWPCTFLDPS